jgi:cation transport ATPase
VDESALTGEPLPVTVTAGSPVRSVVVGLGLSVGAMFVAAFGYLPPVWGALFQEVIDVAVILNALRALHG